MFSKIKILKDNNIEYNFWNICINSQEELELQCKKENLKIFVNYQTNINKVIKEYPIIYDKNREKKKKREKLNKIIGYTYIPYYCNVTSLNLNRILNKIL